MKFTRAYLMGAIFWAASIYAAGMLTVAWGVAIYELISWIAGMDTPLQWGLLAIAGFIFLVLIYVGSDWATEIMWRRKNR